MKKFNIAGFATCGAYKQAVSALTGLTTIFPSKISVTLHEYSTREEYMNWLSTYKVKFGSVADGHKTSPFVWFEDGPYVGGRDDILAWCRSYLKTVDTNTTLTKESFDPDHGFEYDLVVIGGGSGGLSCSQEAKKLGAKVAVLDFVKPSPQGSTWGLGGTCVNVGCIPKKLMHTAALLGESMEDATEYGWAKSPTAGTHSWEALREKVQDHIKSLNFGYRVKLREVGVTYLKKLGRFIDNHTIECTDDKGKKQNITAAKFVIAVGGRPTPAPCPGAEHCISSDDIFMKETQPGKTCVIGAGYVALECAGFLTNLRQGEVVVAVRSILLRGFDRDVVSRVRDTMVAQGTRILDGVQPTSIVKLPSGRLLVTFSSGQSEEFDTVLSAIGRYADTTKLGLENVGITANSSNGKLVCVNEQTSVPNIYAVGDVVHDAPELTPSAILAGKLLARRLFGNSDQVMDYKNIATAVFTPLELGTVGLSEEAAIEAYGSENVDSYLSEFIPLEWSILHKGETLKCFAKVVVHVKENKRVLGMHIACPNAGEVIQGYAVAVKQGITLEDILSTVGIHPTIAEEFMNMTVTKSSGAEFTKSGC